MGDVIVDLSMSLDGCATETVDVRSARRDVDEGRVVAEVIQARAWSWNLDGDPVGETWYDARRAEH